MSSSAVGEILRELDKNEVNELMELYRQKFGVKNFHYLLMYNQMKWDNQMELNNIDKNDEKWIGFRKTFYTHRNGDFRKYGTYVSLHYDTRQSVSICSWQPGYTELIECLSQTKLINWHDGPLITNVEMKFCGIVKEIAGTYGVTVQRARLCAGLYLDIEKAKNLTLLRLPAGYTMQPLRVENAEAVHDAWTNKTEGTVEYVRGLIKINKTLGITRDSDNSLAGWVFQNDFSGLGMLHVNDEFRRQGFGCILAGTLAKEITLAENITVTAWIVVENHRSDGLLTKVGFEKYPDTYEWIQFNKFGVN